MIQLFLFAAEGSYELSPCGEMVFQVLGTTFLIAIIVGFFAAMMRARGEH